MNKNERIGVFGGTFDPIHNAHLDIAHAALNVAELDRVLFVVSARPPHKQHGPCAAPEDRYAMVQAATEDDPNLEASRLELDRSGPSYTVLTLKALAEAHPSAALFLIIGQDSLVDLPDWHDTPGILARAHLLVLPRPGAWKSPLELEGRYTLLPFEKTGLSSTEVRQRVVRNESLDDLVPPSVARLIHARGIYHVRDQADAPS